jgi:hypothetical protein
VVEGSADFSDLPIVSGLHSQPPKLDHGGNKSIKELLLVPGELVYDLLGRTIGVQDLVGGEEPQPVLEVGVVLVVEGDGAHRVHVDGDCLADVGRACLLELLRVVRVEGGVRRRAAAVVVQPLEEAGAVCEADGVRARERDHVIWGEAAPLEQRGELLDVHVRVRQLALDVAGPGDEAVAPAKLDGPVGAFRLRKLKVMGFRS